MSADFDLVIRSGVIVDGTGTPRRTADIAVTDGVIAEIGNVSGRGAREIDADGAIVTPGFVDIHTHYDGQATWGTRMSPSSAHGVTTVVTGNCGVGFAPARPTQRAQLIEIMEGVEDLPGTVLHEGLSWDWESIENYMDVLGSRAFDVDIGVQVCHAPVRLYVMGDRGADGKPASPADIVAMGQIAASAVTAGALGFTTSRTSNHRTSTGSPTPTLHAEREELVGIARAIGATGRGVLQVVSDFAEFDEEAETLLEMMRVSGRPLSMSVVQGRAGHGYRRLLNLLETARSEGLQMTGQVAARAVGVLVGLEGSVNPLRETSTYQIVRDWPAADQAQYFAQYEVRAITIGELATSGVAPGLDRLYELGTTPDYEPAPNTNLARLAVQRGQSPQDLLIQLLTSRSGTNLLYHPSLNYFDGDLDAVREMLVHPYTVSALGDGGAHVGTICDASFPTFLLTHWARDRSRGERLPLEHVVQRQTAATAATVGLHDRGTLEVGLRADINVIDLERLTLHPPRFVRDLPAGGTRLLQEATGYLHTFVAGSETYQNGQSTGALPGKLVRGARPLLERTPW